MVSNRNIFMFIFIFIFISGCTFSSKQYSEWIEVNPLKI